MILIIIVLASRGCPKRCNNILTLIVNCFWVTFKNVPFLLGSISESSIFMRLHGFKFLLIEASETCLFIRKCSTCALCNFIVQKFYNWDSLRLVQNFSNNIKCHFPSNIYKILQNKGLRYLKSKIRTGFKGHINNILS